MLVGFAFLGFRFLRVAPALFFGALPSVSPWSLGGFRKILNIFRFWRCRVVFSTDIAEEKILRFLLGIVVLAIGTWVLLDVPTRSQQHIG